tara:strand:+ start:85 stop:462 length:378 start_codon:yes stop_codon:yes gene_type:complete
MAAKLVTSVHLLSTIFTIVVSVGVAILHTHGIVALHGAVLVVALLYHHWPEINKQPLGKPDVSSVSVESVSPRAARCAEHSVADKRLLPEQEPELISIIKNGLLVSVLQTHDKPLTESHSLLLPV